MAALLTLFDQHSPELDAALPPDVTPDRAVETVTEFVRRVHDRYTPADEASAVAVRSGIDVMLASVAVMVSASKTEVWQQASGSAGGKRPFLLWRVLLALIAVGMTAYLGLLLWSFQRWNELILAGAAAGAELLRVVVAFFAARKTKREKAEVRTRATIHVDKAALLRRLAHAFGALDKLAEAASSMRPMIASSGPVVEDASFTELLQDLMEARETQDGEYALRVLRSLRSVLERHGIHVVVYEGDNRQLFEFQPALDNARVSVTLRPALVQDGRLLRRGLVAEASDVPA